MRSIKSMKGAIPSGAMKGFTIIELVVVILLLGILTATALPRFIDVTEEARDAVRDATAGGLRTGMALYRAAIISGDVAVGSAPTATSDYALFSNSYGYPDIALNGGCVNVYTGLLQTGATNAVVTSSSGIATCSLLLDEVSRALTFDATDGSVN